MPPLLKISEAASLALHTMALLASQENSTLSTRQAATRLRVSEAHLAKVLQRLSKQGLLTSTRGPKGGFALARPPRDITLLDIYQAAEGPLRPRNCLLDRPVCEGNCILGGLLGSVDEQVSTYFSQTTLADLGPGFAQPGEEAAN
jgi:Rrf2 family protein